MFSICGCCQSQNRSITQLSKNRFDSLRWSGKCAKYTDGKNDHSQGEMYPFQVSVNAMHGRQIGWPGVRAQVRLQNACATPTIEKTGDSSTPLRMTRFAVTIIDMYPSHVGRYCHPEEAWVQRPRSASVPLETRLSSRTGTQADEGSTATCDYSCADCTFRHLRGSTSTSSAGRKRRTMLRFRLE